MALEFVGKSLALSHAGVDATTASLGVGAAELWALMTVETAGCGFLPDRRPPIRYERHIFHRLTGGRFDDGDISDPSPGGYGPGGAPQYARLAKAIAISGVSARSLPPSTHSSAKYRQPTANSAPTALRVAANTSRGRRSRFASAPP